MDIVCRRQIQSEHQLIFTAATTPVIVNNSPAPGQRYRANQRKYKQQKYIIQEISQLLFATLEIGLANIDQIHINPHLAKQFKLNIQPGFITYLYMESPALP